jgi:hypothetical protein
MKSITIDGSEYNLDNTGESVKKQLANVQFVNELIMQKNNELQVAHTAQIGYSLALKRELNKISQDD